MHQDSLLFSNVDRALTSHHKLLVFLSTGPSNESSVIMRTFMPEEIPSFLKIISVFLRRQPDTYLTIGAELSHKTM